MKDDANVVNDAAPIHFNVCMVFAIDWFRGYETVDILPPLIDVQH